MKFSPMHRIVSALAISMAFVGCSEKAAEPPLVDGSSPVATAEVPSTANPVVAGGAVQEYVPSAAISEGGHCFLDAVNGGPTKGATAQVDKEVSFGGWVSDTDNRVPTTALFVLEGSSNSYSVPLVAGGERPDVAAALSNEALQNSGYNVVAQLDGVAPGEYALAIVLGSDQVVRCELNAKLTVDI